MNAIMNKTNTGKLLVAVLAMFMIVAGAAVALGNEVNAVGGDTNAENGIASIGGQYYPTLDAAVKDATTGTSDSPVEIKLLKDANLGSENSDIKLQNVIITADTNVTLTLKSAVWLEGTVGFENIKIAADGPTSMLMYVGYGGNVNLSLTSVSFDESTMIDGKPLTVYTDKDSTVTIADSDFTNTRLVYAGDDSAKPKLTITNTTNVDMNISSPDAVTVGTDIKIEGTSTIGDVLLAGGVAFTVPDDTTFTADSIGIYEGSTGSIVTNDLDLITADINDVAIKNSEGLQTIYGNVTIGEGDTLEYPNGLTIAGNVTISPKVDVTVTGTLTINEKATLNLYGTITADNIQNDGTIRMLSSDAKYTLGEEGKLTGIGTVDTSAITKEGTIGGEYGDNDAGSIGTSYPANQVITVNEYLTLTENLKITFNGTLIIPEGTTVTLEDNAAIILNGQAAVIENHGTIIINSKIGMSLLNGANLENYGTITADYILTTEDGDSIPDIFNVNGATVTNEGTITIGTESGLIISEKGKIVNAADATITINGQVTADSDVDTFEIENAGSVTLNTVIKTGLTISNSDVNASVTVTSITGAAVEINDAKFDDKKAVDNATSDINRIRLNGQNNNYNLSGLVVKSVTYDTTDGSKNVTYKALDISGTAVATYYGVGTVSSTTEATAAVSVTIVGKVIVSDSFTTCAGLKLSFGNSNGAADLMVNGTMTILGKLDNNFAAVADSKVTVAGSIVSAYDLQNVGDDDNLGINAVTYTITSTSGPTYYYTTLGAALASEATTVTVLGTVQVTENTEVASGKTVTQKGGSQLIVAENVTLSFTEGSRINSANIDVLGTLYFADERASNRSMTEILSDVRSVSGDETTYTNLATAMAGAESGDTIELYRETGVTVSSPLTIKEGVTVDTKGLDFTVKGTTLTINGTLFINGDNESFKTEMGDSVEGTSYKAPYNVVINGYFKSQDEFAYSSAEESWTPAGAYYSASQNGTIYYFITTAANGIAAINDSYDGVTIHGEVSLGTVTITGTVDENAILNIASDAKVNGNVTLDAAVMKVVGSYSGTVTDGNGIVTTVADTVYTGNAAYSVIANEDDVVEFVVTGTIDAPAKKTTVIAGEVILRGAQFNDLTVDGTATISNNVTVTSMLTVNGTVNVDENAYLYVNTDANAKAVVMGTLSTATATADTAAGSAVISNLYVGVNYNDTVDLGAVAIVSGNVTTTNAYVAANATVPEEITEKESIEFMVEGSLWMTFYGTTAVVSNAPVQDADFKGWVESEDAEEEDIITDPLNAATFDVLYAFIDYDVYTVVVVVDNSIGSVAIDGQLLVNSGDGYVLPGTDTKLTAGQHTITYTLAAGYEGTPTLSSSTVQVSGMTFTLSGDFDGVTNYLTLGGATYSGSTVVIDGGNTGGSDSLGLTDYLLIILVILIVVMAIMVAMRLMRS